MKAKLETKRNVWFWILVVQTTLLILVGGYFFWQSHIDQAYIRGSNDPNQQIIRQAYVKGINDAVASVITQAQKEKKVILNTGNGQMILIPVSPADPNKNGGY